MIQSSDLFAGLARRHIDFYAGVPDSLLKSFCAYVEDHAGQGRHVITANEGNAVALAAGYHLATGRIGAVYLQNSGLGNTVNPLTSLTDAEVYSIPMCLIIGWRGEPGVPDEPQHVKQGRITPSQLDLLDIPYWEITADTVLDAVLDEVARALGRRMAPVALLVRKNAFAPYRSQRKQKALGTIGREDALRCLLACCDDNDVLVATTGRTSRELFELRKERGEAVRDFLTVGSMGHAASIALGVALGNTARRVVCVDGDGSSLMHLGAWVVIGSLKPRNLIHVLLNNSAHESVGGQPTVGDQVDFEQLSRACGYATYFRAETLDDISSTWASIGTQPGPLLFEIRIKTGARDDLGRPTSTTVENKRAFMRHLMDEQ